MPRDISQASRLRSNVAIILALLASVAPAIPSAVAGPSDIVSDDFNACTVNTALWQVVDPRGDGTVSLVGTGTADAGVAISLPAGTYHDVWSNENASVRLMQPASDTDFVIEAKFSASMDAAYQMQGILVEQGPGEFLRFDFYGTGRGNYIFAAVISGGGASVKKNSAIPVGTPLFMSISRQGDVWTQAYSYDGTTWETSVSFVHPMTVTAVGPFVGNYRAAFTGVIDYFFNDSSPIDPEDGTPPGPPTSLVTNVIGQGSITAEPQQSAYYCGETVMLSAVKASGWLFVGWSGDATGSAASTQLEMTADRTVTATFTQDFIPLEITDVAVELGDYDATVTWTTNIPASSNFAYGATPSYELGEVTEAQLAASHSVALSDLLPETTYWFRIFSEAEGGNTAVAEGQTFTTQSVTASTVVSDDFNACEVDTALWQVVDPRGDATVVVVGTGTADAGIAISLPEGTYHDVWSDENAAARLMQPANDTDFSIQAKFDAPMNRAYQMQGILIEQDAGHFLRFDFYSTDSGNHIFAAVIADGSASVKKNAGIPVGAPLYMSITREGDIWTQAYSYDGVAWETKVSFVHEMSVTAVGPFVGNYRAGFTGIIDFFFNDALPVDPEDGTAPGPPVTLSASVTGQGSIQVEPDQPLYFCNETVALSAVSSPGWLFVGWSGDATGSAASIQLDMISDQSVSATFTPDLTPLEITDVTFEAGVYVATITWTTSKPATSSVSYGETDSHELGIVSLTEYVTSHAVTLTGLTSTTLYHFEATSVDGLGNSESSGDLTGTTLVLGGFLSDDFNSFQLDPAVWTVIDPLGDATFILTGANTPDAHLEIDVPGGIEHGVWGSVNNAPRIMQPAGDTDLTIDVKFESVLTERYQVQGMIVEEDADTYIRFDFYSDGSATYILAAGFDNGLTKVSRQSVVPAGFPWYMRVTRTGDLWTQAYSYTGDTWITATTFVQGMTVTSVGPFAANEGGSAPAFTGIVDYFFTAENPIVPEDGGQVEDLFPPNISGIETAVGGTDAVVMWATDEPANSIVDYGETLAYELGSVFGAAYIFAHSLAVPNLQPDTLYYVRIISEDSAGNVSAVESEFTTAPPGFTMGPDVNLWYGVAQEFGHIGMPIPWVNILGNVSDLDGVAALQYAVNGGPPTSLSMGPDTRRLLKPGDFNIELAFADLPAGPNELLITAFDDLDNESVTSMTLVNSAGPVWPLPYTVDWSAALRIGEVAQVVDGLWTLEADSVRPLEVGYDRLIGIGDVLWEDYEVTVPITVHGIDPAGYAPPSNGPAVGLILRWPGHNGTARPRKAFYPLGAIGMFRWTEAIERFQILGNNSVNLGSTSPGDVLEVGVEYYFKMRVQSYAAGSAYSLKVWETGQPEPSEWKLAGEQASADDPGSGSVLLLAHHVDASFGDVEVTPGPFADADPLAISGFEAIVAETTLEIRWDTNYLATSEVSYGLTNAYEIGTVVDEELVGSHAIILADLVPATAYHYRVTSVGELGTAASSGDLTFTTAGCATPGVDTDDDGTIDCDDGCPQDPLKIDPGLCGCGVSDIDSDPGGLPDCGGVDLMEFIDTGSGNSLVENDSLFGVQSVAGEFVFGTASTGSNIHSHYLSGASTAWSNYAYTGRMMLSEAGGGVGVTLLSDYPNSDSYYRLRSYDGDSFHIAPHPAGAVEMSGGTTDTGVAPLPNLWYLFQIEVLDTGVRTELRAKVWLDGDPEPVEWQVDSYDDHANRLTVGTIGLWSMGSGSKYWADLRVLLPDGCPQDPLKTRPGLCGCGVSDVDSDGDGLPDCGAVDLTEFTDTKWGNSLVEDDSLFGFQDVAGEVVFGTASTASNVHSHYLSVASAAWSDYTYTGRMMITEAGGGIGVTLLSDYPNSDSYYRLRRYSGSSFHVAPHPDGSVRMSGGTTNTDVAPLPGLWYLFKVQVVDAGVHTELRAKVWLDGDPEPAEWQVDSYDDHANRLTAGTIGLWSMGPGEKYWADLKVLIPGN